MYLLGYDIGSSSVKASLVDAYSGKCIASAFYPKQVILRLSDFKSNEYANLI